MGFPIHDRFGQVDLVQRELHLRESVTSEQFIEHSQGKTLDQLQEERGLADPINLINSDDFVIGLPEGEISESQQGNGPGHRYIQDPSDPGSVIDMRHFLEAARTGFFGEWLGAGVEVQQGILDVRRPGGFPSAWENEDYKSNFFGVVFRNNYYDPDGDISEQFDEFFTDLKNDELKGFVPAVEYLIQDGIDLAKDGKRALQQLDEKIERQIEQLSNSPESQQLRDRLRNALDRLRASIDPPVYAQEVEDGLESAEVQSSPLVLDLDGDGIELTAKEDWLVRFDVDGDGFREPTGWVKTDDGLLVLDSNNDGYINDNSEFFGNLTTSGFTELRTIDDNNDGFISSADSTFNKLQVWRDLDQDGYSDVQELFSLSKLNITRIKAVANKVNINNAGNTIKETTFYELGDGTKREIVDVWFSFDQLNSYYDPISTFNTSVVITQEILNLPNLKGYGNLPDLRIAMAQDTTLLNLVKDFDQKSTQGQFNQASQLVKPILFRWAKTDGLDPNSRGGYVDARALGFLEKFVGQNFLQGGTNPNPAGGNAVNLINQTFTSLTHALSTRLTVQATPLTVELDALSDRLVMDESIDFNSILSELKQNIIDNKNSPSEQSANTVSVLAGFIGEQPEAYKNFALSNLDFSYYFSELSSHTFLGDANNNTVTGTDTQDILFAGAGNDTIQAGKGADILDGETGNDSLYGGGSNDTYIFAKGSGQDTMSDYDMVKTAHLPPNIVSGGDNDTLIFGNGITRSNLTWDFNGRDLAFSLTDSASDKLSIPNLVNSFYFIENIAVAGSTLTYDEIMTKKIWTDSVAVNSLNWSRSAIFFDGLAGNDTITSGNFNDKLLGGDDNDSLTSNGGDDTLDGGNGNDTLNSGAGNDSLNGNDGNDLLNTADGNDTLKGNAGDDILRGGYGHDAYYGDAGNDLLEDTYNNNLSDLDTLEGGAGSDTLKGGGNNDTYIFVKGYGQDVISDYGTSKSAHLPAKTVDGGSNDTLSFGNGITRNNLTWDFDGKDLTFSLTDATANKVIIDNYYNSQYRVETVLVEGSVLTPAEIMSAKLWLDSAGMNSLNWSQSAISFDALAGNDTIVSGNFHDQLWGGDDNDSLTSNGGEDTLYGGNGNDTLNSGADNDSLSGDDGNDDLSSSSGNDTMSGGAGDDILRGSNGHDAYYGDAGNDLLEDAYNNNLLDLDTLDGGAGNDTLKGGGNNDNYIFAKGYGQDIISDYGTSKSAYLPAKTVNGGSNDTLTFGNGITRQNLSWSFSGQDLVFSVADSVDDQLTIQNYSDSFYKIESIFVEGNLLTQEEIINGASNI